MFQISAQNIHCGYSLEPPRRGGSNECPQSMFLSRKKKEKIIRPRSACSLTSGVKCLLRPACPNPLTKHGIYTEIIHQLLF